MAPSLTDFRPEFRDRMLDLLWRQWTTLGVSGQGKTWEGAMIDPEALLLFSCTMARHDARLFDAILDWLRINGRLINVQRTRRMIDQEGFAGKAIFQAIAGVTKTPGLEMKWGRSAKGPLTPFSSAESLFYLENGKPLPVSRENDPRFEAAGFLRDVYEPRGAALPFKPDIPQNLILRLRALLGVNARCELLAFMALNGKGSPRAVARDCYYFPATVTKALAEMSGSGYIHSRVQGRHRYYQLAPDTAWRQLLLADARPAWIVWGRLFSALEQIWLTLVHEDFGDKPPLAQASGLRRILSGTVVDKLERCGDASFSLGDTDAYTGESLIPFFISRTSAILQQL
jgi:hypothetical protein